MSVLSILGVAASILPLEVKKFFRGLIQINTVAATGSSEADAAGITAGRNIVTGADGAKGVKLPVAEAGMSIEIVNSVSNQDLLVYPNTLAQINALTATTGAFTLGAGQSATFYCDVALHWYVRAASIVTGVATTATTAELNTAADQSAQTETLTADGAISVLLRNTKIADTGTGAYTLAAPNAALLGFVKTIEMTADNGVVTLPLTNVVGVPNGDNTATFDDVGDVLVLVAAAGKWVYVNATATLSTV